MKRTNEASGNRKVQKVRKIREFNLTNNENIIKKNYFDNEHKPTKEIAQIQNKTKITKINITSK